MTRVTSVLNKERGYFIVEAVVGISIVVVAFLGIVGLLTQSLSLNRLVSDQHVGNGLAMEGIELVKNLIDRNCILNSDPLGNDPGEWNHIIEYVPPQGTYADGDFEVDYNDDWLVPTQNRFLRFNEATRAYGYDAGDNTKFKRVIKMDIVPPESSGAAADDELRIKSIVTWQSKGQSFSLELEDHFFNWWPSCPIQ